MANVMYSPPSVDTVVQLRHVRKTVTFTGAVGLGAVGAVTVFTITGRILIERMVNFCTVLLEEAAPTATIQLDVGATSLVGVTNAVNIDANEFWIDSGPLTEAESHKLLASNSIFAVMTDQNVVLNIAAQNVTAGTIIFDIWYRPITDDGALVAA